MKPVLHEFPYRPHPLAAAVLLFLACCGTFVCGYLALYADRGAKGARGIELTREQLRLATGVVAVLSPIGIAALAIHLAKACRNRRRAAITADSILVPADGLSYDSADEIEIPLGEITSARREHLLEKDYVLVIVHSTGTVKLLSERFSRRRDFHAFASLLDAALQRRHVNETPL
jgi:hypothetical protein